MFFNGLSTSVKEYVVWKHLPIHIVRGSMTDCRNTENTENTEMEIVRERLRERERANNSNLIKI